MRVFTLLLVATVVLADSADILPDSRPCSKLVFCDSKLLEQVQIHRVFDLETSKKFVDLPMKYNESKTLNDFELLLNASTNPLSKDQLKEFITEHFSSEDALEKWMPPDFNSDPQFLDAIEDKSLRDFARKIHNKWPDLARKVKKEVVENPDRYSLIPVSQGFIVPGGWYSEMYYWDSNWIVKGLLISGMQETAKGIIENLFELVEKLGHVPTGNRWYFEKVSQPPLLTEMVATYYGHTNDTQFLRNNIEYLEKELDFWFKERTVDIKKDGESYKVYRYFVSVAHPRPYLYYKDIENVQDLNIQDKIEFLNAIWSAVDSGWDISSRWFRNQGNTKRQSPIKDIRTMYVIPVDLNAIIATALQNMANFHTDLGNTQKAAEYATSAQQLRDTIQAVFWNEEDGIWYDYDLTNQAHRRYFYTSNFAPLWQSAVEPNFVKVKGQKILNYLDRTGALDYNGGVPVSMVKSGEQWDFPNMCASHTSVMVHALESIGTDLAKEQALEIAAKYIRACQVSFMNYGYLCENYNVNKTGQCGGGGENPTQVGYGWSIGVALELLMKYRNMSTDGISDLVTTTPSAHYGGGGSSNDGVGIGFGVINYIIIFVTACTNLRI